MTDFSLANYLHPDRVLLLNEVSSKKIMFEKLAEVLVRDLDSVPAAHVCAELLARERLGSTGLGEGAAIPHCRVDDIEDIRCAIIKLNKAVEFDAPDGKDVSIICGLLVPREATDEHLKVLASLAGFLSLPKNREEVRLSTSPEELLDIFTASFDKHAA
jgi:PTS system nitrogen regulatory IIA component